MKRLMALVLVAAATVLVLLFFNHPQLLDKLWLWMVGLAGYLIILLEKAYKTLSGLFERKKPASTTPSPPSSPLPEGDIPAKIAALEGRILQLEKKLVSAKDD